MSPPSSGEDNYFPLPHARFMDGIVFPANGYARPTS
jgi:hypothetical protein